MTNPNSVRRFAVVLALRFPASIADGGFDPGPDLPLVVEVTSAAAGAWELDLDESRH